MKMEYLMYLLTINKHRSISAAAQELYLGQTTLSTILKSVEEELGFKIFDRVPRGVSVTHEGEAALSLIEEISELYQEVLKLDYYSCSARRPVQVVLPANINSVLSLPITEAFLRSEPDGNLDFSVVEGSAVGSLLINNESNIGITYFSDTECNTFRKIAEKYQIDFKLLFRDHQYLVIHRDHPLAKYDSIFREQIDNVDFAMLPHSARMQPLVYGRNFGEGNRYTTFPSVSMIMKAVLMQSMATVLTGFVIQNIKNIDFAQLKVILLTKRTEPVLKHYNLCLIRKSDKNLNQSEQLMVKCIEEYFAAISPPTFSPEAKKALLEHAEEC